MKSQELKKFNLPEKPGVYFFLKGEDILYIGKATSLKDRVKSYFGKDLINTRGPLILDMVFKSDSIKFIETPSVLEALILEANLIKKYQPYYNTKEKSDKSFNYVCFTKDYKVAIIRGKELSSSQEVKKFKKVFGPFPSGIQLREALRILRKFFPYIESKKGAKGKDEFYKQLQLSPENNLENKKNIKNLILFFEGKKTSIINSLNKEMNTLAKAYKFEEANLIKKKIFALNHINDIALIKNERESSDKIFGPAPFFGRNFGDKVGPSDTKISSLALSFRIEAYDIAHMGGKNMVGVMTVLEEGEVSKKEYKKFKIKIENAPARIDKRGGDDTGALKEVLERRFNHPEWPYPSLIVVDGGKAQVNTATKVLKNLNLNIPIVSVLKDERHKPKDILGDKDYARKYEREILLVNSEAHRFAITYHKQMRNKNFLK
ncbi:MAG: GIY-YIG nuclease family protein [Candidatus Pacebacteria bacterium]|nr:GIY-YIG nuclease family protein [Candidatus Paceibacterota bacterium]